MTYYDWPLIFKGSMTLLDFVGIERLLSDSDIDLNVDHMEITTGGDIYIEAEAGEKVDVFSVVRDIDGVSVDEETLNEWLADECLEVG